MLGSSWNASGSKKYDSFSSVIKVVPHFDIADFESISSKVKLIFIKLIYEN